MNFSKLDFYIITVNLFAFILFIFITRLKPHPKSGHRDFVLQIVSLLGGAAGIFIAMLLFGFSSKYKSRFNKEDKKENMMIKVFVSCFLVIQIIAYLIQKGFLKDDFTFSFWNFFEQSKIFSFYLFTINLITFTVFGIDKRNAVLNRPRIRITTLLGLSFFGGAAGGLIAMYIFRHKTKKNYFAVGLPLMIVMQTVVVFFLMNVKYPFTE